MQVPLELTFRHVEKSDEIEVLVREEVQKLEQKCDHISSCRVAIEKNQKFQERGAPYRVRITVTVPPGHEITAKQSESKGDLHEPLSTVIRKTFAAAERHLLKLSEQQNYATKRHENNEMNAVVAKKFDDEGYGFLRSSEGYDVYFHKNSIVNDEFDGLSVGAAVRYVEKMGDKGPQASTVHVLARSRYT